MGVDYLGLIFFITYNLENFETTIVDQGTKI